MRNHALRVRSIAHALAVSFLPLPFAAGASSASFAASSLVSSTFSSSAQHRLIHQVPIAGSPPSQVLQVDHDMQMTATPDGP